MDAVLERDILRDLAFLHQIEQALVHRTHARSTIRRDDAVDLMRLLFADEIADSRIDEHDLESGHDRAIQARHELLADDRLQDHGKLHADLTLLVSGERIQDAVDRVRAARGMQGREDELRHFGNGNSGAEGVLVAHLAQEHDIERFTHG